MNLSGVRVLVTGATGFIGSRLVQWLHEVEGAHVVALVRQFRNASRIGRFPVELRAGDVRDVSSLEAAARDCTHVVHAAVTFSESATENRRVTIEGATNVIQAAKAVGAQHLVYLSTISVFGDTHSGTLTEDTPCHPTDDYGRNKLEAEVLWTKAHESRISSVVLRLPVVYGPWSFWSSWVIKQLGQGRVILPENGEGLCNALYVDDAIRAIVAALTLAPAPAPELCLISGETPVTWNGFYQGHGAALRKEYSIEGCPLAELRRRLAATPKPGLIRRIWALRDEARIVMRLPGVGRAYQYLKPGIARIARQRSPVQAIGPTSRQSTLPEILPHPAHLDLMASRSGVNIARARARLGFEPLTNFPSGVGRTVEWARWAGLKGTE